MKTTVLLALANILLACGCLRGAILVSEHLDNYVYYSGRFHRPESE